LDIVMLISSKCYCVVVPHSNIKGAIELKFAQVMLGERIILT